MIKKLARSIREYKLPTILTPTLVIFEVLVEVMIPLLMANLIDFGIDRGDMSSILRYGVLLIVCAALTITFGVLAGRFAAVASAGMAKNLRHDIYYHIQDFSFSNIDKFSAASLVTRLTTDVNNVQMAYQMLTRMAIRSPMLLTFSFICAININPGLSLIFLGAIPVLGLGLFFIIRTAYPRFTRVFKTYDKLNNVVQENLRGIRVVKSFIREEHEKKKFGDVSQAIYTDFSKAEKTIAFNMPLMQVCIYTCLLLISWFGAHMIVASGNNPEIGMSTGQLMSLITYSIQILTSLMMLSMVIVMLTLSRASAERIVEVLDEKSDIVNKTDAVREVADGSVEFDGVSFAYSKNADKLCLDSINLKIKSGQTVGIIGGTGSSKSTLVQLIPRLYDVNVGEVKVGGVNVRDYDIEALRGGVAMVLQKNVLFAGTIKDNIRWGDPDASDEEIKRVCRLACADEFIESLPDGYDTYIEQGGTNVSGGQKQRLCIARALIKKPKILVLDDSTSAVDTKTDARIRRAFAEEIPDTTKIIIAQRISSVEDADMIVIMDDGRIVATGTHDELLASSNIYREVYESQTKGRADDE